MVRDREGCRQRNGGRPDPTRMFAASVQVSFQLPACLTLVEARESAPHELLHLRVSGLDDLALRLRDLTAARRGSVSPRVLRQRLSASHPRIVFDSMFRATRFAIDYTFKLYLQCFRSAFFVISGILHVNLLVKSSAWLPTRSI